MIKKKSNLRDGTKPFLRWAGGKTWLINELHQFLPKKIKNYHEPFLGGGSIFFHLMQQGMFHNEIYLSDFNGELTNSFIQIRDDLEGVIGYLKTYINKKDFYYQLRGLIPKNKTESAAQFIFLNRTSFNGIYRVNLKGVYNVPYGHKNYKVLFDYENLKQASLLLKGVNIKQQDFQDSIISVGRGDLVFIDPPYTVAHGENGFIKYNQKIFAWHDQERLAEYIRVVNEKGATFILTNAFHPSISKLFGKLGKKKKLDRFSVIGGKKAKRGITNEYLFSNIVNS